MRLTPSCLKMPCFLSVPKPHSSIPQGVTVEEEEEGGASWVLISCRASAKMPDGGISFSLLFFKFFFKPLRFKELETGKAKEASVCQRFTDIQGRFLCCYCIL